MARQPRRPKSHVVGDVGRTSVKLIFEEWGWTADIVQSDYGEDLDCCVFSRGERTALNFRCQIKSGARPKRNRGGDYVVAISSTTCAAWLQSRHPVFLVLYDRRTKEACFIDAGAFLRKNPKALTKQSVSFTVPQNARLNESRDILVKAAQDHYAAFLRVSDVLQCVAFPILMPKYRAALPRMKFEIEDWGWEARHRDRLPAWTLLFETMDAEYLYGVEREFSGANVDTIYASLTKGFEASAPAIAPGQWLALSCCPIEFRPLQSEEPSFWTGELTGWQSFAVIQQRVVEDREYAFAPPRGFITEVARHHLSWDGLYHVDPGRDLAMQLHAAVPLTPAYRARGQSMRANAAGQLLPWSCPRGELSTLGNALQSVQLKFSAIKRFSTATDAIGVIHDPMLVMDEDFTSIPLAQDWEAFDRGAIRAAIDKLPADSLPGTEAGANIAEFMLDKVPGWMVNPEEKFYGVRSDTPMGMPVNLADRKIVIERFHALTGDFDSAPCNEIAADVQRKIFEAHREIAGLSVTFSPFETDLYPMVRLESSWHPPLNQSSADAFLEVESALLGEFDRILPRRPHPNTGAHGTFEVVSLVGNIHFNADYWDGWKASTASQQRSRRSPRNDRS